MRFEQLTKSSNPLDIQAAYNEWAAANGGDTAANQATAQGYLSNLGIGQGAINDAYTMYKSQATPAYAGLSKNRTLRILQEPTSSGLVRTVVIRQQIKQLPTAISRT